MTDDMTDLVFLIYSGTLALASIIGLIHIIVDDVRRFKRAQEREEERKRMFPKGSTDHVDVPKVKIQ